MREEVHFNIGIWYDWFMINETYAKRYCSEDISLIENYYKAIADKERMWDIHHRCECDDEGKTLFTRKQLIEMNLYFKRPAEELIFVTRLMHKKMHLEQMQNCGKISGNKRSIPILQFTKDGMLIKEWQSAGEVQRQLGISQSHICHCLKGKRKSAGWFGWRYKDTR